jgi:hypothetical protein
LGYVRERRNYKLVFADDEYEGLEVVARSASVAAYRRIAELASKPFSNPPSAEDLIEIDNLYQAFADQLVSWNLEEESGPPVPATLAGLQDQDLPFAMAIILAWLEAVGGVSRPLDSGSDSGEMEASLPMDVLTPR